MVNSAYVNYGQPVFANLTPQTEPIPGREQDMVKNNAGGMSFKLDDWERLNRFLILGSDGGTYYVDESKLTQQNAACVIRCLQLDGQRVVAAALDVNVNNRAPKTDPQLFVLVLALKHGDLGTRRVAGAAVPKMVRTGTHALHVAAMIDSQKGWGRLKRRVLAEWFTGRTADDVAFQVLKYQNRDSWHMRDLLRMVHPKAPTAAHDSVFAWVTGKLTDTKREALPQLLKTHEALAVGDIGSRAGTASLGPGRFI